MLEHPGVCLATNAWTPQAVDPESSLFSYTISLCLNTDSNPQAVDPESSLFSYTISLCLNTDSNPQAVDPESSLFSYTISLCLNTDSNPQAVDPESSLFSYTISLLSSFCLWIQGIWYCTPSSQRSTSLSVNWEQPVIYLPFRELL